MFQLTTLSWENGLNHIRDGRAIAVVAFPHNYTNHMKNRILEKNFASNETIEGTTISIAMDESSKHFCREVNKFDIKFQ